MTTFETPLMRLVARPPIVMSHGSGSWLVDESGRRYLDFVQGWAVNALGHAPAELRAALSEQSGRLLTPSPAFFNRPALELSRLLAQDLQLDQVFFANSGAEANDGALKLARRWAQRHRPGAFKVITTHNGFHGRTLATMAASGKPGWDLVAPPNLPGFVKVDYGDIAALEASIDEETCAVMLEPIQGEAGVIVPPSHYLRDVRRLATEHGVLLIADEIQTGCARTGRLLCCQHDDVRADIVTLGKGLGGGVALGAILATNAAAAFQPGDHGSTFGGNPLATACGLAVWNTIRAPEFLETVAARGRYLRAGLEHLLQRHPHLLQSVRGAGLLWAVELRRPQAVAIQEQCLADGLLINAPRDHVLRLMPQLRVSEAEIDEMLERLGQVLNRAERETRS